MRRSKRLKRRGEYWLVRSIMGLARRMPRGAGHRVFGDLAVFASRWFPEDQRRAFANLGMAFPEAAPPLREAWVRAMFRTLGRNIFEALSLSGKSSEQVASRVTRVEGLERLEAAYGRGQGLIAITGHIGCWELLPAYFITQGYHVSVVARRMKVSKLNDELIALRRSLGVVTLDRDSSPRSMIEPLRRGEALGVLIDQHTSVAGAFVPFFGRPALTPTAVAKIALMTGAPIMPMAIYLGHGGRHIIHVLPEVELPQSGTRDEKILELTASCSRAIENLVRIDPKQWVWFHNRWRQPGENDVVVAA